LLDCGLPRFSLDHRASMKDTIHNRFLHVGWHQKADGIFIAGHSLGDNLAMLAGFLMLSNNTVGH
jgi:hypothetical protein